MPPADKTTWMAPLAFAVANMAFDVAIATCGSKLCPIAPNNSWAIPPSGMRRSAPLRPPVVMPQRCADGSTTTLLAFMRAAAMGASKCANSAAIDTDVGIEYCCGHLEHTGQDMARIAWATRRGMVQKARVYRKNERSLNVSNAVLQGSKIIILDTTQGGILHSH